MLSSSNNVMNLFDFCSDFVIVINSIDASLTIVPYALESNSFDYLQIKISLKKNKCSC